jgi:hypothetical protein
MGELWIQRIAWLSVRLHGAYCLVAFRVTFMCAGTRTRVFGYLPCTVVGSWYVTHWAKWMLEKVCNYRHLITSFLRAWLCTRGVTPVIWTYVSYRTWTLLLIVSKVFVPGIHHAWFPHHFVESPLSFARQGGSPRWLSSDAIMFCSDGPGTAEELECCIRCWTDLSCTTVKT